jgi:hypothetical protein
MPTQYVQYPSAALSSSTVPTSSVGKTPADKNYLDLSSTSITTVAYRTIIAATAAAATVMEIFAPWGEVVVVAFGAAAAEVDQFYVTPGGNGPVSIAIPAGTRISMKAITANVAAGYLIVNLYR